jgi:hypothetical protein
MVNGKEITLNSHPVLITVKCKYHQLTNIKITDIRRMVRAFGAIVRPVGALRNKNRQVADFRGSQVAGLAPSKC